MIKNNKKFKIFDCDALINFHKRIFFSIIVFSLFYFRAIFRIVDVMIIDFNHNEFNMSMDSVVQRVYKNEGYKKSLANL